MSTPAQVPFTDPFDEDPQPETPAQTDAIEQVQPKPDVYQLLPMTHVELTQEEKQSVSRLQLGRVILGPVAAAVMTCPQPTELAPPGSILSLLESKNRCPHMKSCVLLQLQKAPHGNACPLETNYITERFVRWSRELGKEPGELTESERIAASELTSLDLSEQRCLDILGEAEHARMTDLSVKEVDTQGNPISYEKVIHVNQQALEQIRVARTRVMKAFELTPEMKTKKARYEGGSKGADLASVQSANADEFRRAMVVEAE
jgi:hypothetical protein